MLVRVSQQIFYLKKASIKIQKKSSYTHPKLVSAFKSLNKNLPYLFTYKKYTKFNIHHTTNAIDGGVFSPMKKLMNIHKGLKIKIVDFYFVN